MNAESAALEASLDCMGCGAPRQVLWTYGHHPQFERVEVGNWNSLERCGICGSLWVEVPHEPHSTFSFWTLWPSTGVEWRRVNAHEGALIIHEWHSAVIREAWELLAEPERLHIEWWRKRSYGRNAIDRVGQAAPRFVFRSVDLAQYLDG